LNAATLAAGGSATIRPGAATRKTNPQRKEAIREFEICKHVMPSTIHAPAPQRNARNLTYSSPSKWLQ
jgi:hypothetical protein